MIDTAQVEVLTAYLLRAKYRLCRSVSKIQSIGRRKQHHERRDGGIYSYVGEPSARVAVGCRCGGARHQALPCVVVGNSFDDTQSRFWRRPS